MTEGGTQRSRVAVVMTCHNRCDTTSACLRAVDVQRSAADLHLYVTDDGSTDGTSEAIREIWPDATIIQGTGDLYWAAGMALAEQSAVASNPDFLLWLNDDTNLNPSAVKQLLELSAQYPSAIIVGATEDPLTGSRTYGGRVRIDYHPQRTRLLSVAESPQRADTFHGNVVLIPISVRKAVGPIDHKFPHAYADDDYGLRATALGIPILQAPGTIATCRANEGLTMPTGGLRERWRHLQSPKGLPWRAQVRYLRRHGDWRWPLILAGQQVRRLVLAPRGRTRRP